MRTRDTVWHDLVKFIGEENENEVLYIFAEVLLDVRDLLANKTKKTTTVIEVPLTEKEQVILNNLDKQI